MTAGGPPKGSIAETVQTTDGFLRHAGREFLVVLYTAVRSLKLYPIENAQVQKALDDLTATTKHLLDVEKEIELRLQGEFIFVNSTRLRLDLDNYASFSHILGVLRQSGIGAVRIDEGVERKQLQIFVALLLSYAAKEVTATKVFELAQKLSDAGVTHIGVEPPLETDEDTEDEERQKEAAKRTYARSVAVTKEVINSIRMGRTANVKKVKRAVQAIVDQVLNNEASLMGLTTLRDYDEYTFTHSVNVCIFSVALGRKLGLTKLQLYDLGMAALFHDVGKSRVPLEVLNKQGGLTDEEWRIMQAHPWLGVLTLFGLRGYGEIPYRGMIVAYEHHMKTDLTGYPKSLRARELSIYSKIVAVADGFDAATSRRVYQTVPIQPDQVLKEMWENPRQRRPASGPDSLSHRGIPDAGAVARGAAGRGRRGGGLHRGRDPLLGSARRRSHDPALDAGRSRSGHDGGARAGADPPGGARRSGDRDDVSEPGPGVRRGSLHARRGGRRRVGPVAHRLPRGRGPGYRGARGGEPARLDPVARAHHESGAIDPRRARGERLSLPHLAIGRDRGARPGAGGPDTARRPGTRREPAPPGRGLRDRHARTGARHRGPGRRRRGGQRDRGSPRPGWAGRGGAPGA